MKTTTKEILVVDDERDITELLRTVLEDEGFGVDVAHDSSEAMDKMNSKNFDLVIVDALMPREDGWRLIEKIRSDESSKNTPVVVFTILESKHAFEKAETLDVSMVTKSSGESALVREVQKLLKR